MQWKVCKSVQRPNSIYIILLSKSILNNRPRSWISQLTVKCWSWLERRVARIFTGSLLILRRYIGVFSVVHLLHIRSKLFFACLWRIFSLSLSSRSHPSRIKFHHCAIFFQIPFPSPNPLHLFLPPFLAPSQIPKYHQFLKSFNRKELLRNRHPQWQRRA